MCTKGGMRAKIWHGDAGEGGSGYNPKIMTSFTDSLLWNIGNRLAICDDYLVGGGDLIYRGQIAYATVAVTFDIFSLLSLQNVSFVYNP